MKAHKRPIEAEVLEANRLAEERLAREEAVKCDWDDPMDRSLYRRQDRMDKRVEIIERIAPTGCCPGCNKKIFSMRSWVVSKKKDKVLCRECHHGVWPEPVKLKIQRVFGDLEVRVQMEGWDVFGAREACGLTQGQMAKACGWSRSYQSKLESGKVKSVTLESAEVILQVLQEFGIQTGDVL